MVREVTAACRNRKVWAGRTGKKPGRGYFLERGRSRSDEVSSNEDSPGRVKFHRTRIVPVGKMKISEQ
jgi:hypothetical protein